jgi:hypothetical protein
MTLAVALVAALAVAATSANAGNGDKVTGGGQVLLGTSGKGSTIAFTAQGTTTAAKGQVQFIDRTLGAGKSQTKFHGVVDCVEVTGNYGIIGGYRKGAPADRFDLRVVDNGEPNQGNDLIQFDEDGAQDVQCGDDNAENAPPDLQLARGNAQVRDGDRTNP